MTRKEKAKRTSTGNTRASSSQQQPSGAQQQQRQPSAGVQTCPSQHKKEPAQGQQQQQRGSAQLRPGQPQQQPGTSQQQSGQQQQPPAGSWQQKATLEQLSLSESSQPVEMIALKKDTTTVKKVGGKTIVPFAMQDMYINQIPKRSGPGGGVDGRRITVETNMFKIVFNSNFKENVVHYDVLIEPDRPKFLMRRVFEAYRSKHFPNRYPAFDGKRNAYSAGDLPFGDHSKQDDITVFDHERHEDRVFKMYMKKAALVNLSWLKSIRYGLVDLHKEQQGIQALDIILRHGSSNHFIPVGRSLFAQPEPGRVVSLTNGLDLWVGVFQSAIVGWRPYLNLDGLKVQYEIPGQPRSKRTYRVSGLVECPRTNKFTLDDGTVCTVEKYFEETKKYKLRYPDLPCLWVARTNNKKIHLPVELCTIIAGQVTQKKMDESQTSKMIREAATNTNTRKDKIMRGFANMRLNQQPTLTKEFNLSVTGEFEKVPARVLDAPKLKYLERQVNVMKGVWRADKFCKSCQLEPDSWTILNLDGYVKDRDLYTLHDKLQSGGQFVNMSIGKALTPFTNLAIRGKNITQILRFFEEKKQQKLKLVVVIIPNFDNAYSVVKQISEIKIMGGIVTQCLKAQTLKKLSDATITNILLKINSKLNGVNHTFAPTYRPLCLTKPCMLVGADVTHPSPDATDIPSIAAVAASYDASAFQYKIELRLQAPREEIIADLEQIMINQLYFFYQQTKRKPMNIIFYRDGVSEGQLPQVMHFELSAIRRAIARLEKGDHKINIMFLVVQKRHHIRLFPTDKKNSDDRNFNVQAGTIVDTDITHPTHIDFYLVSHASIQGTARPTKYRCICNEIGMSEDEIEQLTYYLCHMFARCTRSVSYPAPTYYAHLAAFRARALIHDIPLNINNLQEEQRKYMNLQMNDTPMFFV
ncbi:protein argonaute-2 isoform X2 [Hylaeus anthracinus]|uniref:protein argonaute-2 isoform X2 n=1 Tax=Hylaeus anthracinus TaxID=313031 RepID=UPI0023B8DCE1|nr:protein argonaute-2 isoform X2 [Hylaeus anthracinus]